MNDIIAIEDSRRFFYRDNAPRPEEGPVALPAVFGVESMADLPGDLEIDIGFGRGRSIFARAEMSATARIVGIEVKTKWAYKVAERVARDNLSDRVRIWAADAREVLSRATPDGCVARMFVHFPDPWWKKRHAGRMVVGDDFARHAARLLRPGGQLFVQTDVQERAEQYEQTLQAAFETSWVAHNPFGSVSNREVRSEEDGLPIHRLLATRRQNQSINA